MVGIFKFNLDQERPMEPKIQNQKNKWDPIEEARRVLRRIMERENYG
jgi:hypothetical protein